MVTIKQYYGCARACRYRQNIIETIVIVLGKTVRLFLKDVFQNTEENLRLKIKQKSFIFQVKFGLIPLVSMEPEIFLHPTFLVTS